MTLAARDLLAYLAARLLPAVAAMGLSLLCIHSLSAEQYALYSASQLAAGVAAGFVGGASGQAMLRYAHELAPPALRRGLLGIPLLASAVAAPLVLAWLAWRGGLSASAGLAAMLVPLLAVLDTRRNLFVARGRAAAVFRLDAWRAGVALPLAWLLLHSWSASAAAALLAQALSVLAGLGLVRVAGAPAAAGTRRIDAAYLGYGLGMAGWMAAIVALSVAERAVLADTLGLAASGRYAAQADVINAVFAAGSGALAAALMPAYLAQSHAPDAAALRRLLRLGLLGVAGTAAGCVLLGALLGAAGSGRIARALTGDVPTALMLVAAGTAWAMAGFVQKPVELRGQTWRLFAGVAAAVVLFVLLAPALVARQGAVGAAEARLAAGLFYTAVALRMARGRR